MFRELICLVASVAVLETGLIPPYRALGNPSNISKASVAACRIEQFGVTNALWDIVYQAHVAIGVEAVVDYKTEPTINIDFPGGTLGQLLDRLISQTPQYRWIEDDGIIHVLWHGAHLPIANVVMFYPGVQDKTRLEIWEDLAARPELKAWLEANHCSRQEILGGGGLFTPGDKSRTRDVRISIDGGSITLAQLLDQVAIKSGKNYWSIVQSPASKPCQVSINVL